MRLSYYVACWVLSLVHQSTAIPVSEKVPRKIQFRADPARANAVKSAFQFAWDGYYKYAFPNDELKPLSRGKANSRNGWGASAVDALSTATLMELPNVIDTIVAYIPTINYNDTSKGDDNAVSVFETTIRYLGGMLAGYDLLSGPFEYLAKNDTQINALLSQSKRLADYLSFAFDTPSGIPDNTINFMTQTRDGGDQSGLAVIGTLVLEWTRLSDLTGDPKYARMTQKAEEYLLRPQPPLGEPFPGLLGTNVNLTNGKFLDGDGGWGGGTDSFYEYLIKMWVYDNSRFAEYRDRWIKAADSSITYAVSHPSSRPDLTFLAYWREKRDGTNGTELLYRSGHLACFDAGNFLLGGLVLDQPKYIKFGLELVSGCHDTYISTTTRIGPEGFGWLDSSCSKYMNTTDPKCSIPSSYANQSAFYEKSGYYITDPSYDVRPEVMESYYYAYRVTGDPKYQEWAWDAFTAINATARQGVGFSYMNDVMLPNGGPPTPGDSNDNQESFLFAEVMKYAFLIFSRDGPWQVNSGSQEEWVFNTEAHPFKVAGRRRGYGWGGNKVAAGDRS